MSQENVEIVRPPLRCGTRATWTPFAIARPGHHLAAPGRLAGAGTVRGSGGGHAPVRAAARDLGRDPFESISDFIDAGDRVAVRLIRHGAGHGPESNIELTGVYAVRKGRVFAIEFFWDHAEALEALGPSE